MGTLICKDAGKLFEGEECLNFLHKLLVQYGVVALGEVLHHFPNNSFTLLVGLAESHISIHTWPERLTVQLDVFLCNYENNNTEKCENLFNAIVDYFEAVEKNCTVIERL
jgi:S-adenosylmethionine decarboxylase